MLWGDSGIGKTALLEPAQCLAFAARRLRNEPVVMLLTGHDDPVEGAWEKLPAMEVRELGDDDARLLARALAPQADESVIRRTIRAAAGNPLALQELTTSVAAGDLSTHPLADEQIAVGPRLRRAFRARIEKLSAPARTALLLAAADDRSDQTPCARPDLCSASTQSRGTRRCTRACSPHARRVPLARRPCEYGHNLKSARLLPGIDSL